MRECLKIDTDPYIPTGVPATPEQVAQMIADGKLPADIELHPSQRLIVE